MVAINPELISGLVHTVNAFSKTGLKLIEKGADTTSKIFGDVAKKVDGKLGVAEKAKTFDKKIGLSDKVKTVDKKFGLFNKAKTLSAKYDEHANNHPTLALAELSGASVVAAHEAHKSGERTGQDINNFANKFGLGNTNGRSTTTTLNKFAKDSNQISGTGLQTQTEANKVQQQTAEAQR